MKKYQLGALAVRDKELQDTKEEIVIELVDRMQKYIVEGKAAEILDCTIKTRASTGKFKADNYIDLAGYAACGMEIAGKAEYISDGDGI